MDGFVRSVGARAADGLLDRAVLPFAYSLARTFTVANRWFCSAPCQTIPTAASCSPGPPTARSRRLASLEDPPPPNGTIFDRLHAHGISWRNYFSDVPQTAIIPQIVERYPTNLAPIAASTPTAAAARCPRSASSTRRSGPPRRPAAAVAAARHPRQRLVAAPRTARRRRGGAAGHRRRRGWAHGVVEAVLHSPAWPRTLLIYTLRRARRLLRPRAAAGGDRPRLDRAEARAGRRARRLRHLRPARPGRRRLARTRSRTPSPTSSTTTPRCWRRSRRSGTCRRSPTATPTRRPSPTSSTRPGQRSASRRRWRRRCPHALTAGPRVAAGLGPLRARAPALRITTERRRGTLRMPEQAALGEPGCEHAGRRRLVARQSPSGERSRRPAARARGLRRAVRGARAARLHGRRADGARPGDRLRRDRLERAICRSAGPTSRTAGSYRLRRRDDEALFGYNVGPHSWKRYQLPPRCACGARGAATTAS